MQPTSAARSIRIRRSPNRSDWAPSSSKVCAPICRRRGRNERFSRDCIDEPRPRPAMTQDEQKQAAARAAIEYVDDDAMVGVGTGSTANHFIDELAKIKHRIKGAVAS